MSIYSAFFDSVKQKETVLDTSDQKDYIGKMKDFRASLKLDYLIYGSILFTDAQIFDGAMFHIMANDNYYWEDFVNFIKKSTPGSIVIRHGLNSISERIDDCLSREKFELSSLAIYDEDTISDVTKSRTKAVRNNRLKGTSNNSFYRNMSYIKKSLSGSDILAKGVYSSWDKGRNRRHLLSLFRHNHSYYKSFRDHLKSFNNQLKPFDDYDKLSQTMEDLGKAFNYRSNSTPKRSEWKIPLDTIIRESDNEDFKEVVNKLLLYLDDCYISLHAYQHRCKFASLVSPFSFDEYKHKQPAENIYQPNIMGVGVDDEVWDALRDECFDEFLKRLRYDHIRSIRDKWLSSLYSDGANFDAKLLRKLINEVFIGYFSGIKIKTFSAYHTERVANLFDAGAEVIVGRKIIKPIANLTGEIKNNQIIVDFRRLVKDIEGNISDQIATRDGNSIKIPTEYGNKFPD